MAFIGANSLAVSGLMGSFDSPRYVHGFAGVATRSRQSGACGVCSKARSGCQESDMTGLSLVALTVLVSYLIGAIPFGYLIARWRGVDILKVGSGNIGATNVGRVLGRRFGILVFILDFAKGAVPVGAAIIVRNSLK